MERVDDLALWKLNASRFPLQEMAIIAPNGFVELLLTCGEVVNSAEALEGTLKVVDE